MKTFTNSLLISLFITILFTSCKKDEPIVLNPPIVTAGTSQTIQLPVNSITLSGSADSNKNKITSYMWSEVSGPNVAFIVSPGSNITLVNGLVSGVYVFQFMAINANGLTGIDSVKITVVPSAIITLNLQPANNATEAHIWGNSAGLDQSTPISHEIGAMEWTYNGASIGMRGALKFDLSTIPANAIITSAKLSLYSDPNALNGNHVSPNSGSDNAILIQKITTTWNAATVNWVSQPASITTDQVSIASTSLASLDLSDIDVTTLVGEMVNNNTNYGFLIRLQNEVLYNSRIFCSSKYTDATKYPKLVVEYQIK